MDINLTSIQYGINKDGTTGAITVGFSGMNPTGESLVASVKLTGDKLDDLTRADIETQGRAKMLEYVSGEVK